MIKFEKYSHVNELVSHYLPMIGDIKTASIIKKGVGNAAEAELFSRFIIKMVDKIRRDTHEGVRVLGRKNNTDILPDISDEVTGYMRQQGYHTVWEKFFVAQDSNKKLGNR